MFSNIWTRIQSIYYTIQLYLLAFIHLTSPGTLIWRFFGNRKGKIPLLDRDLICDGETLLSLEKSSKPLDQFTNALFPFVPLFLIDDEDRWKQRRDIFSYGNNQINQRLSNIDIQIQLQSGKGNLLWIIFEHVSRLSFELVFNRKPSKEEFQDIYLGLMDINKILKRFSASPNLVHRQVFYQRILQLINDHDEHFLFDKNAKFFEMEEIDQVSSVGEDFLTTISVQCTDLICHLLILYDDYADEFHRNFDNCLNETLRLFPLTDLWVRQQTTGSQRNWIASLVQLNRNGWTCPDLFLPSRWNNANNPTLFSWGFDSRRCPAQKFAIRFVQIVFQKIINNDEFWIKVANNFQHERTFPYGCPVWIGYGQMPHDIQHWTFPNQFRMKIRRWICEKIRMFDQKELN